MPLENGFKTAVLGMKHMKRDSTKKDVAAPVYAVAVTCKGTAFTLKALSSCFYQPTVRTLHDCK